MKNMVTDFKKVGNSLGVEVNGLKTAVCGKKGCNNLKRNMGKDFKKML